MNTVNLEELAKTVKDRRLRYEMLGMLNTAGMTEIERAASRIQYEEAFRSLLDAERTLREAVAAKCEAESLILRLREKSQ